MHVRIGNPANGLFFLTVAFAALAYPLRSVIVVSVLNLATFTLLGRLTCGHADPHLSADIWLFSACLAATSAMCGWQTRIQTQLRDDLAHASRTDPLTGALNRRGFEELFAGGGLWATPGGRRFGLLLLDLANFKDVNDTHGHSAGDDLLRWTVRAMTDALAASAPRGVVARLGGDEFAVVLPRADAADAGRIAHQLRTGLSTRIATTGVAAFPADGTSLDELHRHADAKLYSAKRSHRSRQRLPAAASVKAD